MSARNVKSSRELSVEELRLLGEAIDSSSSPLTLYDQEFQLIYANEASRQTWPELHEAFARGEGLEAAAYAASRAIFKGASEKTIRKAAAYVVEQFKAGTAHDMLTGAGRWMKVTHSKIHEQVIVGFGIDITDLKIREQELEKAKRALTDLVKGLSQAVLVVDKTGIVTTYNSAYEDYCRTLGFTPEIGSRDKELTREILKKDPVRVTDEEIDACFAELFAARFNKVEAIEEEFTLEDGRHILRHQHYVADVGNIITITDVSDIKNAQLDAEAAERSKSDFLANMSHEIRTPMNGVLGMAYLLSQHELEDEQHNLVDLIQRSGKALMTIINDILDFSKIEAGHVSLLSEELNLRQCLQDVCKLVGHLANEKGILLTASFEPGTPDIYLGDPGRVQQIITNVLGNAVKFTEEGSVSVNVRLLDAGDVMITVKDTGIGIPSEKLDAVFNKFSQAENGPTRKHEGTGLGLSIAKRLANVMGGDILVESVLGQGSRFDIRLGLKPAPAAALPKPENKALIRAG